jgi:multisubunit Na+/H+ antiporter MnhC subunit
MTELAMALCIGIVATAGLWLAMSRDSTSIVLGLALLGSAANLFVFAMGRLRQTIPPLIPHGATAAPESVADPLPQALVLTAIVIGFTVISLGIALTLALRRTTGDSHADRIGSSDVPAERNGEPEYLP